MPPKRAAGTTAGRAKKSRSSGGSESSASADAAQPSIPRNKRWAAVSGSANIDAAYKQEMQNPLTAYNFVCMCKAPFYTGNDDEEEEPRTRCDAGETCLCNKPASEHPDHIWILSAAGKRKFFDQRNHFELRCPDNFSMYTFNDHEGYGCLEMLQNLILDFEEAAGNYKEQWVVCEALAFFLKTDIGLSVTQISGGDTADETFLLIGRLFMSMLAIFEREHLLAKDSEIKNLGMIMALFMDIASTLRQFSLLKASKQESLGPAKDKKKWYPHAFDNQILAYARKYDITLLGLGNLDALVSKAKGDGHLPVPESNTGKADPFGFAKTLKRYKTEQAGITGFVTGKYGKTKIGGDCLDITSWSSAERQRKNFDNKDPLGKKEIDALKQGLVLGLG